MGQYYNWTIDELLYAAQCGFDGVCTNEHHQNAYGFMPSPNIMGSVLAKLTNGSNVAIVQMGATLPTSNPPIRVAEEYGMLDCISGGRLVAGMPLGTPMDANLCYGITPMEHRERYREAFALTLKAWQAREIFAWNGRYYQLAEVNLWPRPIQQPHPHMTGDRYGHRSDQAAQDARATAPQRLYESHDKEPPNDRDQAHPYHQIGSLGRGDLEHQHE